ncbi:hypothetical protein [Hyalangium sp.]|uniref:hypothetical protein n=1 Tax=Hyalangium sp. TaxID=2028555 RepID=UPI002D71F451|nr:hypothetical protein [Hyalangium sp.]HYH97453.1 hypothetical protein [Hyalangium sp.]
MRHGRLALLWVGLLLGSVAAGKSAPKTGSAKKFVSETALKDLECVTRWEQICTADQARQHRLEVSRSKVKYLASPDSDVEYAIIGRSRKVLQLATPGSRRAVATLKLEKDTALYKGPDNTSSKCRLPNCAEVPECALPEQSVTVRFVSETRLSQRLRELMPLVPEKTCPEAKLEYTPPKAGELCLNTRKPYAPPAGPARKKPPVSIDSQSLRLFLSSDERMLLNNESKPLLEAVQAFYTSRLARNAKARGSLTVRLQFPQGGKKPEVYVQKDEPRDANLTACLSAALRSKKLFPWRPSQVTDLELSFVFAP